MTEPTDAELIALLGDRQFSAIGAVREALRRWGTPPAVSGKPVAWWIPKAEQFCLADKSGVRPFAKAWEPLYTTPQPTQAQAGAVPLTDEPDCGGESCDCRSYCKKEGGQHGL